MKRWRTDGITRRLGLAAALLLLILVVAVGRFSGGGARSATPASANLSRERLERVGDYIRSEIAAGTTPGAIILAQQHGRPILRGTRRRKQASDDA